MADLPLFYSDREPIYCGTYSFGSGSVVTLVVDDASGRERQRIFLLAQALFRRQFSSRVDRVGTWRTLSLDCERQSSAFEYEGQCVTDVSYRRIVIVRHFFQRGGLVAVDERVTVGQYLDRWLSTLSV